MHVYFYFQSQRAGEEKLSQAISAFADNVRAVKEFMVEEHYTLEAPAMDARPSK